MNIYTEINKAWATLFGFKVESDEATFNDKPIYWNNNAVETWDDLLSAKPSDLKQSAGVAEIPNTKTYEELMTAENFSYSAFDWTNEHGTRLGFSIGYLSVDDISTGCDLYLTHAGVNYAGGISDNGGLGFPDFDSDYIAIGINYNNDYLNIIDNQIFNFVTYYSSFYARDNHDDIFAFITTYTYENDTYELTTQVYYSLLSQETGEYSDWDLGNISWDYRNYTFYFDDGTNLPSGLEWNETLESYFVPKVKETETTTILTQTTATQAMLGAQIMTHVSLWGMGIGCACFIIGIFKLFARSLSRR